MLTGFIDERDNHNFLFKSYTYECDRDIGELCSFKIKFNVYNVETEDYEFEYIVPISGEDAMNFFMEGVTIRKLYEKLLIDLGLSDLIDSLPSFTE